jgi:hypothetical protein
MGSTLAIYPPLRSRVKADGRAIVAMVIRA